MGDTLAKTEQHRPDSLKIHRRAADHDCQATRLGTDHAARHRSIQPTHAGLLGQLRRHFPRRGGLQAGKIHQQLATFPTLGNTARTKHHLPHHRRVRQAQHQHIGVLAQLGRCGNVSRAGFDQRRTLRRVAVPHCQRIPRSQQAPAHWQPHQANSGKAQRR
ncbi:hypothetical protein D3C73_949380 [compost metagenome]